MLLKSKTFKITLCGVVTSLCTALMFFTNLIPNMTFAIPSIAGTLMVIIVIEINKKWAFATFFCSSMVCLFTVADKEAVLVFVLFLGYYPIFKSTIESIKSKLVQLLIKFFIFNFVAVTEFFIATKILLIPTEIFSNFSVYVNIVLSVVGNVTFFLYDISISLFVYKYIKTIHPKFMKMSGK